MAESPSETSSDAYAEELLEMLKWNMGILTVLLQEAGGVVEIKQEELESIDVGKARTVVTFDEDRKVYIIEGVFDES